MTTNELLTSSPALGIAAVSIGAAAIGLVKVVAWIRTNDDAEEAKVVARYQPHSKRLLDIIGEAHKEQTEGLRLLESEPARAKEKFWSVLGVLGSAARAGDTQ